MLDSIIWLASILYCAGEKSVRESGKSEQQVRKREITRAYTHSVGVREKVRESSLKRRKRKGHEERTECKTKCHTHSVGERSSSVDHVASLVEVSRRNAPRARRRPHCNAQQTNLDRLRTSLLVLFQKENGVGAVWWLTNHPPHVYANALTRTSLREERKMGTVEKATAVEMETIIGHELGFKRKRE